MCILVVSLQGGRKRQSENFPKCTRLKKPCQNSSQETAVTPRRTSSQGEPDPQPGTSPCRLPSERQGKAAFEPQTAKQGKIWVNKNTDRDRKEQDRVSSWMDIAIIWSQCSFPSCPFPEAQGQLYRLPSPSIKSSTSVCFWVLLVPITSVNPSSKGQSGKLMTQKHSPKVSYNKVLHHDVSEATVSSYTQLLLLQEYLTTSRASSGCLLKGIGLVSLLA